MNSLVNFKYLNRKKLDPGAFIYTGSKDIEGIDIQLFKYNSEECEETKELEINKIGSFNDKRYMYWLNIYGLSETDKIADICQKLNIENIVIQDILDINQRPKFQEFEEYSFLTIKSMTPSDIDISTEQISFIFGENFIVTFQQKKADYFEHLRVRLRENKGILRKTGSDLLLYTMLESILDNYFKTIIALDNNFSEINLLNPKSDISPAVLKEIENNKKLIYFIKKSILPIKEFAISVERGDLNFISKLHLKYFMEIKDLCLTVIDNCDMIISSLESNINLFFSLQGHRANQVMKTLTVVASIFIPLTFVAGIYGMNFIYIPELNWHYGYFAFWGLMLLLISAMLWYFKKKDWF
jgi:magnesium transporter